jgi:hypothetical protein
MHINMKAMAAALLVTIASGSGAQQQLAGPRFQGWLGCWSSASSADVLLPVAAGQTLVCITPTSNADVVNVATITDGKVMSTHTLDATGRESALDAKGCTGVQSARWSADERRIYLKSRAECGDVPRTTSGILSMTALGDWLDVQQVTAGGAENVRVMRYRDVGVPSSVPADIASALSGRSMATQSARMAASSTIGRAAVLEASRSATPAVVEAWVLERGQPFELTAKELIALADAGIAPRVIDAMVAVSNPSEFAVTHRDVASRSMGDTTVVGQRTHIYLDRNDPWSWGYDPYGYSPYDYRPGLYNGYGSYGYGYNGYGSGYGGYYGSPVIIVGQPQNSAAHGRRVKGDGYQPPPSSTATTSRSGTEHSTSASGSSSSSSGSSSSGSSGSSSSGRTAQPKP